jgi:hypothetical protein
VPHLPPLDFSPDSSASIALLWVFALFVVALVLIWTRTWWGCIALLPLTPPAPRPYKSPDS